MTLHTGPGCSISNHTDMLGYVSTDNCDVNAFGQSANQGCQIKTDDDRTYGEGFNNNGGGMYATEVTADFINIFFFPVARFRGISRAPHPTHLAGAHQWLSSRAIATFRKHSAR